MDRGNHRLGCLLFIFCSNRRMRAIARVMRERNTPAAWITPGEEATIAAELAMPDLDLIKQGEQGVRDRRGRFARGRSGR